jgi:hypothetical protein
MKGLFSWGLSADPLLDPYYHAFIVYLRDLSLLAEIVQCTYIITLQSKGDCQFLFAYMPICLALLLKIGFDMPVSS